MLHLLSTRLRQFAFCLLVLAGWFSTAQAEVPFEPALANSYREGVALEH